MAIVGDLAAPREPARYQATLGIVPALAIILGPVLGGLIVDRWSWGWIFLINLPVGALAFGMIAGALLSVLFTTSFLLMTVEGGGAYAWASWQILGLATVSIASLAGFVFAELRAAEPITPLSLLASGIFSISSALFFMATAALFVAMLFVPLMLQSGFGLSAFAAGGCIIALLLGLIVATMASGAAICRTGRYKCFPILGALLGGAGLAQVRMATPVWAGGLAHAGNA